MITKVNSAKELLQISPKVDLTITIKNKDSSINLTDTINLIINEEEVKRLLKCQKKSSEYEALKIAGLFIIDSVLGEEQQVDEITGHDFYEFGKFNESMAKKILSKDMFKELKARIKKAKEVK